MNQPVTRQLPPQLREWSRDLEDKKIAGVCAGLSRQLGIPVTAVRALFVLLALPNFSSVGIVAYLALWFLMPASPDRESGLDRVVASVNRLTGEALFDPSGDEETSRDRAPSYHDPV
jgi:phage shock protein PspC (stress-responsive transcriptional regulator)